jgi:hypothetical protein
MKYCVKLKNKIIVNDYEELEDNVLYGTKTAESSGYRGLLYKHVKTRAHDEIFSIIPSEYRHKFYMNIMKINVYIPPHTDSFIKSTINLYIKPENYVTKFYDIKIDTPTTRKIENQREGAIFDLKDLNFVEAFIANPYEIWALNVTKPHSVTPTEYKKERIAIVLGSELEYDVVYKMLKDNNQIE